MLLVASVFLLFRSLSGAVIYNTTGGEVVISPSTAADLITIISWYHNNDIAVEWSGGDPFPYQQFKGCTTLNTRTGNLTISNLTQEHSGSYTAEINNFRVAGTTEIQVISPVPKPTVSMRCEAEMTYCTLTCEGNTTDAGPVDYSWRIFDVHNYHRGQQFNLTKDNQDPWFECVMKNPISSETSEEFLNPFSSSSNRMLIIIISLVVTILFLIGLVVGIYMYCKYGSKKENSSKKEEDTKESNNPTENSAKKDEEAPESNNPTENTKLLGGLSNGVVPSLSTEEPSAQTPQKSSVVISISEETAKFNTSETSNPDKTSEKPKDEPENSSDQVPVDICEEIPGSSTETENSPKKEGETLDQVPIDNPETSESNHQTEGEETFTSVAESSNKAATDSQDQETSRNHLKTAAFPDSEESSEESNGKETTRPLLEEPNRSIPVSA